MSSRLDKVAWLQPRDQELAPYRPGLHFAFFNALTWQIAIGTPLVLLLEALGASSAQTGLAYSFVYVLTPVQMLSTALLPRYGFRRLTLAGWSLRGFMVGVPIVITVLVPFVGVQPWMLPSLIASTFVFCLMRSMGMAASLPWLMALVPPAKRGAYFGSDQLMAGVASMFTLLACVLCFRWLPTFPALTAQFAIAMLGSWLAVNALAKLSDAPAPVAQPWSERGRSLFRLATRSGRYTAFLWLSIACLALTTPLLPFVAYFLRAEAGLGSDWIMGLEWVRYLGTALAAWAVRRRLDAVGARPFLALALASFAALALWWALGLIEGLGGRGGLLGSYILLGVGTTLWQVGSYGLLPKLLRPEDQVLGLTLHSASSYLGGGLATLLWGWLFRLEGGAVGIDHERFRLFFLFAAGGLGVLVWALRGIQEPNTEGGSALKLGNVVRRPDRAVAALFGAGQDSLR